MSAQLRYRTLVHNIGRIYASAPDGRTNLLQTGLDEIVTVQSPTSAKEWNTVGIDSERLLRVWVAKETDPAAAEVASQLVDILYELAEEGAVTPPPAAAAAAAPALVVHETAAPPPPVSDKIVHVNTFTDAFSDASSIAEEEEEVVVPLPLPPAPKKVPVVAAIAAAVVETETEEEAEEVAEEEEEEEVEEEAEETEETEETEEAEEEEEEAGMEVEQIFIRGRSYWLDANTKKMYAVIDGDEVGDEVGAMVDGKPRFLSK
jgi:hypothetical protein